MANRDKPVDSNPRKDSEPGGDARYPGDGPGKVGLTSGEQPDLVAPSGVNQRESGAGDGQPMGGGELNFDDEDMAHPRGRETAKGGTWEAQGGDSGKLGRPAEILSDRIGPSDPDSKKQ